MDGERIIGARGAASPLPDFSPHIAVLEGSDRAWFWFCEELLLLDVDRESLKASIPDTDKRSVYGQLHRSRHGWLEFRTRHPYPDFIGALSAWVTAHQQDCRQLEKLRFARMTRRNKSGDIIDRQRDDTAWRAQP